MNQAVKMHPTDIRDAARIAAAAHFVVHLRLSPTRVSRAEFPALGAARSFAREVAGLISRGGPQPGIYAVGHDGVSTVVPSSYQPEG